MTPQATPSGAVPDRLRWQILQAAKAGHHDRHRRLVAEAEQIERAAASRRAAHAIAASKEGRLF